jgi:hypothetical protein
MPRREEDGVHPTTRRAGVIRERLGLRPAAAAVVGVAALLAGGAAGVGLRAAARPAPPSPIVALPVVPCPTDYGVTPPLAQPPTPNRLAVLLPAAAARRLSFYSNGFQTLLAARGWACHGLVAADGGRHLSAFPAGEGDPLDPAQSASSGPGVTVLVPSPGTGQVAAIACALFPQSNLSGVCAVTKPAAETVQRPTDEVALFHDPPHVRGSGAPSGGADPADGAVIYVQQGPAGAAVTCTLATSGATLCSAVIGDFLTRSYPASSATGNSGQ